MLKFSSSAEILNKVGLITEQHKKYGTTLEKIGKNAKTLNRKLRKGLVPICLGGEFTVPKLPETKLWH